MPFVDNDGARIFWDTEGSGTPVLLIMGHLYSSDMWYPLLPALTARHRAIRFDNRGVGDSDTTGGVTVAQMAADALAVLDAAGVDKAHVYGVSMGGGIAGEFAMRHPDRVASLTLGCTMLKTEAIRRPWIARLLYRLPARWFRKALVRRNTPAAYGSAAPIDRVIRDRAVLAGLRFTSKGIREQAKAIAAYAADRAAAERLAVPTLVLHGDQDPTVDVEHGRALAAIVPGARLQIFAGAGHNYLVAASEPATAAFLDFIAAVDATAARG